MRGKIAVAATHKIHHPVGAGHAPPATVCYNEYNGLDCCNSRTYPPHPARSAPPFPQGGRLFRWGHPALYCYKQNHHPVGAGQAPPATVYYNEYNGLACRHGYYAARCNHPVNETQRVNATGEQCSPLQAKGKFVPTSLHRTIKKYARAAGIPNLNSKFCTLNSA